MRTLYININNEQIQSNIELEVLNYDVDSDFFFYLGKKIARGCKVENENALITDFNTPDNEKDYQRIISQWNELKAILFSEKYEGEFDFTLPNGYIDWLRIHPQYFSIHDANFSNDESVISIDLEELYEESIEELQRKILRKLKRNDLHLEIDEIVFNDDAVTRNSAIVRATKEKYDGIGFKMYKKWLMGNKKRQDTTSQACEKWQKDVTATLNWLLQELGKHDDTVECPVCGSHDAENDGTSYLQYKCNDCGHRWGDDEDDKEYDDEEDELNNNKALAFDDFFPVCGVTLNKTTVRDVERQKYRYEKIEHDDSGLVTAWVTGSQIRKEKGSSVFTHIYMTKSDVMFPEWSKLGFNWKLSYDDWISLFKRMGFTIIQTKEPQIKSWEHGPDYLGAKFVAMSNDYSLKFELDFSFGREGSTQYSRSTLYSISVFSKDYSFDYGSLWKKTFYNNRGLFEE